MAPVTTNPITTTSGGLQAWTLFHQTTATVICWNLTMHQADSTNAHIHPQPVDESRKTFPAATRSNLDASSANVGDGGHIPAPPFGFYSAYSRPRYSKNWPPPGSYAYSPGGGNSSSELEIRDKHALLYIVVVLLFYSTGIIVAIVMYLKREKAEIEEEKAYEDYASFRSDPDRWARYFRVQRMIAHLDRVEREATEKRRIEQQQPRPSIVGPASLSPGPYNIAGSDGKPQPPLSSSVVTPVSSKRTDSGRSRRHRESSPLLSCRVVVVEAKTDGSHIDGQRCSGPHVATDPDPMTIVGTYRSGAVATMPVAARSSVVIRRLSPSPSAHARLDRYSVSGSVTSDSPWVSTPVDRVRLPGRVQSFAGRSSSKASPSSIAFPREEAKKLLQPMHLEVHRTGSWSPRSSSVEVPIGLLMNVDRHRRDFSTTDVSGLVEDVDTSTV